MLDIENVHHISLPVSNLARSREFYSTVLGLPEIDRPPFTFGGAWFRLGDLDLHLIVPEAGEEPTFRHGKGIDSREAHFAIRVRSYTNAVAYLESIGYRRSDEARPKPDTANPRPMRLNPAGTAGFPQIFILDPDCSVIEINAESVD